MKEEDVSKLKVAELKEELKKRELTVSGLKADLAKRLLEAVKEENQDKATVPAEDALDQQAEVEDAQEADAGDATVVDEVVEADSKAAQSKDVAEDVAGQPTDKVDTTAAKAGGEASEAATKPKQSKDEAIQAAEVEREQIPTKKPHEEAKAKQEVSKQSTPLASLPSGSGPAAQAESQGDADTFKSAMAPTDTSAQAIEKLAGAGAPSASKAASKEQEEQPKGSVMTTAAPEKQSGPQNDAIQKSAGESTRASSKATKTQQHDRRSRDRAADKAASQLAAAAAAADSAAPQVDILGSLQVVTPLQETAEEELDYDADEVMVQASAPAKSEAKKEEGSRKRPAESGGRQSSKAQKTEESQKSKRAPIAFKPRDSDGSQLAENGQTGASGELRRSSSQSEKRSVFERLHGGAAKEAGTPRRAPPSREAASRALFITGFVRPFTESQAKQMLSETGQIRGFWMPKIKDRAYVVFASEEEAEATRNAVSGIEWPVGNGNSLRPKFVSLEDAERTIKTGQPPEMRMEVSATATAPQPPRAAAAAAAETARAAPARPGAPAQNGPAAPAEREKPKDMRQILEERRRARDGGRAPAASPAQPAAAAAPAPKAEPEPMEEEDPPKSLEDLFRKTETKPWLYWLPAAEKQDKKEADSDAAQLPGPPPAEPMQQ